MNDCQEHRGPDAEGIKLLTSDSSVVGLGHRRLSIIDLASGQQPMSNEDGTIWIVYNGEIYNHMALRGNLQSLGHEYRTRCDTETILHAYEQWGTQCLQYLRGMYAFAIWDSSKQQLFAARDRMGVKPYYYSYDGANLVCASEVKALFASDWIKPELNRRALPEHLTLGYLTGHETLFRGVYKLLPGHHLIWKDGRLSTEQYWEIPHTPNGNSTVTEAGLVDEFLTLFRDSVKMRLMSDVPLGVFLSGGLDSSAIAATMATQMSGPVKTFAVGFESHYFSEFTFAREVAKAIGADHHEVVLKPEQVFANLPQLIWHEDEPIRNVSSVALYEVARLARSHVKVVLTGEGSDELFAGYERYWATLVNMRWGRAYHGCVPGAVKDHWVRKTLWQWPLPLSVKKKLSHSFLNHSLMAEEIFFDNWYAIFPPRMHEKLFTGETWDELKDIAPYRDTMQLYHGRAGNDLLDRLVVTDQKSYLVELLQKQDAMSMAASIESRVPFLDHHMVEFAARVPSRYKIRGTQGKYLVKRAMEKILPRSIIYRKKMGFPVPMGQWLRNGFGRLVQDVLLSDRTAEHGIFNPSFLELLLQQHVMGTRDNTDALWAALNLELWTRIYLDGDGPASVTDELMESRQEVLELTAGRKKAVSIG